MTYLKTRLLFLGKILVALLVISLLLLIVGRDLFPIISPWKLLLHAGFGALLLIAVVVVPTRVETWLGKCQPRSAAQGK